MADKLSIMNAARSLVGAGLMTRVTGTTPSEKTTIALYPTAQLEVFDLPYDWQFCSARSQLAAMTETPPFGYDLMYKLPNNLRRIRDQVDASGDSIQYEWRREVFISGSNETDVLLTNQESPIYIKYTVFRANEGVYPAWFAKLIYLNLAFMLAEPLKKDKAKAADLFRTFELSKREAEAANEIEIGKVSDKFVKKSLGNTDATDAAVGIDSTGVEGVINRLII